MNFDTTLNDIRDLFLQLGSQRYGSESVSQLDHALQCATLAEAEQSSPELIAACLLHDIGHLLHPLGEDATNHLIDDRHEYRAIPYLQRWFSSAVTSPICLHVKAKRYLCATDSTYWSSLSPASQRSLEQQGGIFSSSEAQRFIQLPFAPEAVQLRRWDDFAKVPGLTTPPLDHFIPYLKTCLGQDTERVEAGESLL